MPIYRSMFSLAAPQVESLGMPAVVSGPSSSARACGASTTFFGRCCSCNSGQMHAANEHCAFIVPSSPRVLTRRLRSGSRWL